MSDGAGEMGRDLRDRGDSQGQASPVRFRIVRDFLLVS